MLKDVQKLFNDTVCMVIDYEVYCKKFNYVILVPIIATLSFHHWSDESFVSELAIRYYNQDNP